jgi:hypothetical protein
MWGSNLTDFAVAFGIKNSPSSKLVTGTVSYSWNSLVNLQIREAYLYKEEISKTFL